MASLDELMKADELAEKSIDLSSVKICDLGINPGQLNSWLQVNGLGCEHIQQEGKSMNIEEQQWVDRVLDSCRQVHAVGVVRFYVCKPGENTWTKTGLFGCAAVVTEANLRNSCAHFIRLIDLDGFNPNTSVMVQQELYRGMKYIQQTPFFHTFEMSKYIAGISFVDEQEAKLFSEKVEYCLNTSAKEIVEDDYDKKERVYKLVGDNGWRQANDGMSIKVAKKYAEGGITDGVEVKWKKPAVSPELAELLKGSGVNIAEGAEAGSAADKALKNDDDEEENVINLLKDKNALENSKNSNDKISDGIQMVWKRNATPLTGLEKNAAAQQGPVVVDKKSSKRSRLQKRKSIRLFKKKKDPLKKKGKN
eukprot:TRINITY_DN616_c0_g1_i1.p1 TRINITY_DN616_c0_g1~~TRINITY_DN616_c0_g1_i1.p1  ORF type:complete len:364 (+),score=154.40 TRINITY_DN616_c0_g1_i1:141-1232(+)